MGKVAEIKTKVNEASVDDFISKIKDEQQRKDTAVVVNMMKKATKEKPKMWGVSMIGFGEMRYKSERSGREVDWFKIGCSPRKGNISLHLALDVSKYADALKKLGKHKTGVGCLYINKLEEIDTTVLEEIINNAAGKKK